MKPEELTYRFHKFRPSDRAALREAVCDTNGKSIFKSALYIYLDKWAKADWLTEYDLERIASWIAIHLTEDLALQTVEMAKEQEETAKTEHAQRTYHVFTDALEKQLEIQAKNAPQTFAM